jgi:hypothetical protein
MDCRNDPNETKEVDPVKTNDTIDHDTTATLAAVVRLLRHAAVCAWAQAEAEGPRSPLHLLGLGIHIAYCQALAMLPAVPDLNGQPPVWGSPRQPRLRPKSVNKR